MSFVTAGAAEDEAQMLLEDLMHRAGDLLVSSIESEAATNPRFAEVVAQAHVGDLSGAAADRFRVLQREIRDRLQISYWEGLAPINPNDIPRR